MTNPVTPLIQQGKSLAERELAMLRADLDAAVKAHRWYALGGFLAGIALTLALGHLL